MRNRRSTRPSTRGSRSAGRALLRRCCLALALLLFFPGQLLAADGKKSPPNVIILLADDWGFSDVGAFGGEIATPNIDALARAGVRFSNFHVAGSCSPSRAMLQTGVLHHRAGLGNMPETIPDAHRGKPGYDTVMNFRVVTIAQLLKAQGYRTYLTGKWHLGSDARRLPEARGYDRAFSLADAGADNFAQRPIEGLYARARWFENGKPADLPSDFYSSRFIVDKMIDYIEAGRPSGKPFLASVNFLANHIPIQAPDGDIARYSSMYREGWSVLRRERARRAAAMGVVPASAAMRPQAIEPDFEQLSMKERAAAIRTMQAYAAMASAMDREVGRLLAYLKDRGDFENSIFIFLSDNGAEPTNPYSQWRGRLLLNMEYDTSTENIGRRNSFSAIGQGWAGAAASPLAGYKFSALEGGLRVPLIIAVPGDASLRTGTIAGGFAHVSDIMPTIAELAGVTLHEGQWQGRAVERPSGRSLVPLLYGTGSDVHGDAPLGYELSGNAALFRGGYKLVRNLPPAGDGEWHLYDVVSDPGETRDLSADMPQRFRSMLADYEAYAAANFVLDMPEGYNADDQINHFAWRELGRARVIRAAVILSGLIGLLLFLAWYWRRRRS